jgi:transposase
VTIPRDSRSTVKRIEVITSVERRRRWSRAEKERWVALLMEPDANASEIARRAGVDLSLLYRWRRQLAASHNVPSFVPVTVAPAELEGGSEQTLAAITIQFSGGACIKIEGAADERTLSEVIDRFLGLPKARPNQASGRRFTARNTPGDILPFRRAAASRFGGRLRQEAACQKSLVHAQRLECAARLLVLVILLVLWGFSQLLLHCHEFLG